MVKNLEWSYSALSALRKCNRMYYFQYIAPSFHFANPFRRKAYELKKSKNLLMWRGSVVDKIIELEIIPRIRDKQHIDYDNIANKAVALAKRQFDFSEKRLYRIKENSESKVGSDYCILDIHEANVSFTLDELDNTYSSIQEIISNIPSIEMPEKEMYLIDYLSKASFIVPNLRGWKFEFEQIKVSPQIDLFMFIDNQAIVLDWKVSESNVSDYSRQLVISGITVIDTYRRKAKENKGKKLSLSDIRLLEANLFSKIVKDHPFTKLVVDECIDYIYLNSDDALMLTDGKSFDQIKIEDFPITDKEGTCFFCRFRPLCKSLILNNNHYDEKTYFNSLPNRQSV